MAGITRGTSTLLSASLLAILLGCAESGRRDESDPGRRSATGDRLRISEEARANLGLVTSPVQSQVIQDTVETTGWLAVIPGKEVTMKAAATGFVVSDAGEKSIEPGTLVTAGQRLATWHMFLSPQEEAQLVAIKENVDILVRQSKVTLEIAEARFHRLQALSESGTVSEKEKELAKETMDRSRAAYEEAQQQFPFLPSEPYQRPLQLEPVAIESPQGGRVSEVYVCSGQLVLQGEPLWKISDWSSLWIRVPVFEGDLPRIDLIASAEVRVPGSASSLSARPTGIPQPTREGRRTVDLIYELGNAEGIFRPGQAVAVSLPTGAEVARLAVPQSAVIWDGAGGTWVYLEDTANSFRRQRIEVGRSLGDLIIINRGLAKDQSVVTIGAEALYGEEFKDQIPALENDD